MPPDPSCFQKLNLPPTYELPASMSYVTLSASPNTDLWRKPPSRDTSTAPILYTSLRHAFIAAEVTISADWELEWDQAGLVIFAGAPPGRPSTSFSSRNASTTSAMSDTTQNTPAARETNNAAPPPYHLPRQPVASKWVKAGLEFYGGRPNASSVCATGEGADWSLSPLQSCSTPYSNTGSTTFIPAITPPSFLPGLAANPIGAIAIPPYPPSAQNQQFQPPIYSYLPPPSSLPYTPASPTASSSQPTFRSELRVKLERVGYALWIWFEDPGSVGPDARGFGWKKLREVTWFFWGVEDKAVRVGIYACRPANFGMAQSGQNGGAVNAPESSLCVDFDGLEIF